MSIVSRWIKQSNPSSMNSNLLPLLCLESFLGMEQQMPLCVFFYAFILSITIYFLFNLREIKFYTIDFFFFLKNAFIFVFLAINKSFMGI